MIGQIIVTIFVVWLFLGIGLSMLGLFINNCTDHYTRLDIFGFWLLALWLVAIFICVFVYVIIIIWK